MIWWLSASALLLAAAGLLLVASWQRAREDSFALSTQRSRNLTRIVSDYLASAGIDIAPEQIWMVLAALATVLSVCVVILPLREGLVVAAALLLVLHLTLRTRAAQLREQTLRQLPSFLNQVNRRIAAGSSIDAAINESVERVGQPLHDVLKRALWRVRLGYELHDALEREATMTGLPEFYMLATVLRLNEQFGGSVRGVLDNIVDILTVQQQSQRELRALTGETRVTAMVLATLPFAAAAYMLMLNRSFLLDMWRDDFGQQLLVTAISMQLLGIFVLWRMVKSV